MPLRDLEPGAKVWVAGKLMSACITSPTIHIPVDCRGGTTHISPPIDAVRATANLDETLHAIRHMSAKFEHLLDAFLRVQAEVYEAAGYNPIPKPSEWLRPR